MLAPKGSPAPKPERWVEVPASLLKVVAEIAASADNTSFAFVRLRKILDGMKSGPMSAG